MFREFFSPEIKSLNTFEDGDVDTIGIQRLEKH